MDRGALDGGFAAVDLAAALPEARRIDEAVELRCAYFSGGVDACLWLVLDFMDFDQPTVMAVRAAAAAALALPVGQVHLLTTHNHGADEVDRLKLDVLCDCAAAAARQAAAAAEPLFMRFAKISVPEQWNYRRRIAFPEVDVHAMTTVFYGPAPDNGYDAEPFLAFQRRMLLEQGAVAYAGRDEASGRAARARRFAPGDPELAVWRFENRSGAPLGWFCRFAAHAVCCNRADHYSSDYPFYVRRELERLGGGGTALFFNGPCGDIAPGMTDKHAGYERKLGLQLAATAWRALAAVPARPLTLVRDRMAELPILRRPDFPAATEDAMPFPPEFRQEEPAAARRRGERLALLRNREFLEAKCRTTGERTPGAVRLGLLQLNDTLLLGLPGETFWTTAGKIVAAAGWPPEKLVTATEHDRTVMYIVPPEEYHTGGYETTCCLTDAAFEPALVAAAAALIRDAANKIPNQKTSQAVQSADPRQ